MQTPRIARDVLELLETEITTQISPLIMERGLAYYGQGRVGSIEVSGNTIDATVFGTDVYRVRMDVEWFALGSWCTCLSDGPCKHMAAVFYALCADYEESQFVRQRFRGQTEPTTPTTRPDTPDGLTLTNLKAKDAIVISAPHPGTPATIWIAYVRQEFAAFAASRKSVYMWYDLEQIIRAHKGHLTERVRAWPGSHRLVYETVVTLAGLQALLHGWQVLNGDRGTNLYAVTGRKMDRFLGDLFDQMRQWSQEQVIQIADEHVFALADFVRELLVDETQVQGALLDAYQMVWWRILSHRVPIAVESAALQESWVREDRNESQRVRLRQAQFYLAFLAGADEEARTGFSQLVEQVEQVGEQNSEQGPSMNWSAVGFQLFVLGELEAWHRLREWLRWMDGYTTHLDASLVKHLCAWWMRLYQADASVDPEAFAFFSRDLPAIEDYYLDFLLQTSRFNLWIDYHLANLSLPSELHKDDLKYVGKHSLASLLPLYHHAVERTVKGKNRDAYKQAVRLLKKLASYYKKLKRIDDWERFITRFTSKYARLRALQEELRKAGLIV